MGGFVAALPKPIAKVILASMQSGLGPEALLAY